MADPELFGGFGPDALSFLSGLATDNTKTYFAEHRGIYTTQVAAPMKSLVVTLGDELRTRISPSIRSEPKIGRSLFRINRDLRFAKDKTPYHTHLDAVFWEGESPRASPGFIMRITAESVVLGSGVFVLRGVRLNRYRRAVIDPDAGGELDALIAELQISARGAVMSEPRRTSVPRGFPVEHPRSDLLRRDGFHMSVEVPAPELITSEKFVPWCADHLERFASLEHWLVTNVGD
jgi:uncharacterized protein (TIGR02453 family)